MTARRVGELALEYLTPVFGGTDENNAALADLRALMARCAHLEAEEVGLTKERNVARDACEALAAMRDAAQAEVSRLRAALDEIAGDLRGRCEPGTTAMHCYNVATRALSEGVKP